MLNQDTLLNMNEADLRTKVLIPLLRTMGYRDVHEYHGGAGEKGKDIVGWKLDELDCRVNLAVVAKATPMSGKAGSIKGAAGEVQTQIRQCFGIPYNDTVSGTEQNVGQVWVVSNHKITKEAQSAILAAVADPNMARNVRFIEGDALWKLVKQHMPLGIWQSVSEIQKLISNTAQLYSPHVTISGNRTTITLEKSSEGVDEPLVALRPRFKDQQSARHFYDSLRTVTETGRSITIPGAMIENIVLPEPVRQLLGSDQLSIESMEIGPELIPTREVPVRISITCEDGDSFDVSYVKLGVENVGTKVLTLSVTDAALAFKLLFTIHNDETIGMLSITERGGAYNAVQYYESLRLAMVCTLDLSPQGTLVLSLEGKGQDESRTVYRRANRRHFTGSDQKRKEHHRALP